MGALTHFDDQGASRMVDVSEKAISLRTARASGVISLEAATLQLIFDRRIGKGNVLEVARIAGIMAAKRTGDLIPLCHPLGLDGIEVNFKAVGDRSLRLEAIATINGRTGVEMEALVAVSVAALTIYDMCKSVDKGMSINEVRLEEKSGGRSGRYLRPTSDDS